MSDPDKLSITGTPDTDRLVIQQLSDTDVSAVCSVSRYINSVCDNAFWSTRFINKYGVLLRNVNHRDVYYVLKGLNEMEVRKWAIRTGHIELLKGLEKRELNELLIYAASVSPEATRSLLELGAYPSYLKSSALVEAIRSKSYDSVALLLEAGTNSNGRHGNTLCVALHVNRLDIVKLLFEYGFSFSVYDETCLENVIHNIDIDLFTYLLSKDILQYEESPEELLSSAVKYGRHDIAEVLLREGIRDEYSLVSAVMNNDVPMVKLLLNYDYNSSYVVDSIFYAIDSHYTEILEILLATGAADDIDSSELLRGALYDGDVETVKVLLKWGADTSDLDWLFEEDPEAYEIYSLATKE